MDASVLLTVAICLLVILVINWYLTQRKLPPGPIGLPIIGYTLFLSKKPYLDLQKLSKKYGNILSLRLGSQLVVALNDIESTKEVHAMDELMGRPPESPFDQTEETKETGAFNDVAWKEQRKFSLHMLKDLGLGKSRMETHIQEEINDLLEHLEQQAGKPYRIYDLLAPSMSNNIASLMFGKRFKYNDPVRNMMDRVLRGTTSEAGQASWRLFFPWITKLFKFLGLGAVNKVAVIQKELNDYIMKEIEEHEKTLDPSNIRDYIDGYLLEIKKRKGDSSFSKPVLRDMVFGFFGAGSETVRLSVEWLLLTAAAYQDAQQRVQREIDEVVGKNNTITYPDHKKMPFTEAFIMELNRWRTLIPLNILRYALKEAKVKGYHIPKGSQLLSNLWAIHHDPDYWGEDADEFRPERFLTEDGKQVRKWDRYVPFSVGKRACPGEPMAKVEVFLYFTYILQKFQVKVPDGKVVDFEGNLGIGLMPKQQELIFTKRT